MNLILISLATTVLMITQNQIVFDVDMINTDHPDGIVDIFDNNKHKDILSHKQFSTMCDELYNDMRKK